MTDQEKQKLNAETINATVTQMLGAKDLQIAQLTGTVKVLQAEIEALKHDLQSASRSLPLTRSDVMGSVWLTALVTGFAVVAFIAIGWWGHRWVNEGRD